MSARARASLWAGILGCAAALAAQGCGDDVTRAGPAIFVEKWDAVQGCFASCPEQGTIPESLDLGARCSTSASGCGLAGGEDSIRVTVDLGDVEVARRTELEPPGVDLVMDGEVVSVAGALPPRAPGKDRAFFSGVLDVPAREVRSFALRADFGEGYGGESATLSVASPVVELVAPDCDGPDCAVEAGSGELLLAISASRGLAAGGVVFSSSGEGPLETEIDLSAVLGRRRTGSVKLPVPWVEDSLWTIEAAMGEVRSAPLVVALAPLSVTVEISGCGVATGDECTLGAGATTTLVVSAPKDVLASSATISTKVDGLLGPATFTVDLDTVEGSRRSGAAKIEVASQPGAIWQVLARVGDSVRASAPVQIGPPG